MIRIITDSASDISQSEAASLGIQVLPIEVVIDGKTYHDGIDLSPLEFYEKLAKLDPKAELPHTSQVNPSRWAEVFEEVKAAGDQAIVVSIGSGFSGGYNSLCIAAEDYKDIIFPVDSNNVSMGERVVVMLAKRLVEEGVEASKAAEIANHKATLLTVVAVLDSLEHLKRGGRISKAVAFVGGILKIKPVVAVLEGRVKLVGKIRGPKAANIELNARIKDKGGIDPSLPCAIGYTGLTSRMMDSFLAESNDVFPNKDSIDTAAIGPTIGTHVGPDCVCLAFWGNKDAEKEPKAKKKSVKVKIEETIKAVSDKQKAKKKAKKA